MKKVANYKVRPLVQAREAFTANNIFAVLLRGDYVVYSYGRHWPMFLWRDGVWYENAGRYSVTTSKHRGQAHPLTDTVRLSADEMRARVEA